ncbi:MAG TPA: UDP-N-acetylglucosamine--N-acetylmuramyl-(pentapeptide) pyrophosphoryl-undecaprenol N-acetylglucosamine transferase [Candidatus Babeliales bacterium]|nr:UDP-N-acetylglucosamine--N-acetylmuramyl-(pentapeptide) pyrophosphoryl-undecaprenol N-acetylglucosamine transferase [Candidatus Babeliales bacterium]
MNNNLCFVAGRSGGHIVPALTLAQQHKKDNPDARIIFFSTHTALDISLIQNRSFIDKHLPLKLDNVPYARIYRYPSFIWHFIYSIFVSVNALRQIRPTQVISMGGYISIPVCIAAKLLRIPITIYELNAIPGKAAKVTAYVAKTVAVCFEQAAHRLPANKCEIKPYPVRFTESDKTLTQAKALELIHFCNERTTLFILGGSQGSVFINELIKEIIEKHPELHATLQIIHQTGAYDKHNWHAFYTRYKIPAIIFAYHDQVEHYYAAADLIICRSGAGTLWEIAFFNKKAITIPIVTKTTDHQVDNAQAIVALHPQLFTMLMQDKMQNIEYVATALSAITQSKQITASEKSM